MKIDGILFLLLINIYIYKGLSFPESAMRDIHYTLENHMRRDAENAKIRYTESNQTQGGIYETVLETISNIAGLFTANILLISKMPMHKLSFFFLLTNPND